MMMYEFCRTMRYMSYDDVCVMMMCGLRYLMLCAVYIYFDE